MSYFQDQPTLLVHLHPKLFNAFDFGHAIPNKFHSSPNDNKSIKRKSKGDYHMLAVLSFRSGFVFSIISLSLSEFCNEPVYCTTWKRKQTMEYKPHRVCEQTKSKQTQNQVTSHSNWTSVILFNLAQKQGNGIIKGWLSYLTSGQKEDFLSVRYCLAQHDVWSWRQSNLL